MMDQFKGRLRRMQAAQVDSRGGYKVNVEAQVAQNQLQDVLQAVISSSLKVASYSLVIAVRTSKPVVSRGDLEEAKRTLNDRRQRVIHAITRMNGARAIPESLAAAPAVHQHPSGHGAGEQAGSRAASLCTPPI